MHCAQSGLRVKIFLCRRHLQGLKMRFQLKNMLTIECVVNRREGKNLKNLSASMSDKDEDCEEEWISAKATKQWRGVNSKPVMKTTKGEKKKGWRKPGRKDTNYRVQEKRVWGESWGSALLRPAGPPRQKHSNKRIIYWRRKEGEVEWRDERRGNTVQRHLRAMWVKHWPHLNIHSQCVTFSPTLAHWRTRQPEPIWSHRGSLLVFLFKIHRQLPPT